MSEHNEADGTWSVRFSYRDWKGRTRRKQVRGFGSRQAARAFERDWRTRAARAASMPFDEFAMLYLEETKPRVRASSFATKKRLVEQKIRPFFSGQALDDVAPLDIVRWQQWLAASRKRDGAPYAPAYLRNINAQLSIMFNYAVRNYGLARNPCLGLPLLGAARPSVGAVWSREEAGKFLEAVRDDPRLHCAFSTLYWTGIRVGELLALTPEDIDFEKGKLAVRKTYQRVGGEEIVGPPKTRKSRRVVSLPKFLNEELRAYVGEVARTPAGERVFRDMSPGSLHRDLRRGCAASGVKVIRVHDLRHSHVSLLVQMGFSAVVIAERLGHESTDITFRYAHLFQGVKDEMAGALDALRRERMM